MEIEDVAARIAEVGATVSGARTTHAGAGLSAFGAGVPGRLGELGRSLAARHASAMADRDREAAAHGARMTDLAGELRAAADRYREVEQRGGS
jgi:hypothetical protein